MADNANTSGINELKSLKMVFVGGFFVITVLTIFVIFRLNDLSEQLKKSTNMQQTFMGQVGNINLDQYQVVKGEGDEEEVVYSFKRVYYDDMEGMGMEGMDMPEGAPEEPPME